MFPTAEEAAQAANIKNIDVFIITQDGHGIIGRTEVHMAHYAPTNLGTKELLGMSNDASEYNNMLKLPKKATISAPKDWHGVFVFRIPKYGNGQKSTIR